MSDRLLFVDNDVFVLLSASDMLEASASVLGFGTSDLRRLQPLTHMLKKSIEGRSKSFHQFSVEHRQRALAKAETIAPFLDRPSDEEVYGDLSAIVDPGEAVLYSILAERKSTWITSGDAMAMRRICGPNVTPNVAKVKNEVRGRVISVESVVSQMLHRDGYERTHDAFSTVKYASKTLRCIFQDEKPSGDPTYGAKSYLRDLCHTLGIGFLMCPPCPDHRLGICSIPKIETN